MRPNLCDRPFGQLCRYRVQINPAGKQIRPDPLINWLPSGKGKCVAQNERTRRQFPKQFVCQLHHDTGHQVTDSQCNVRHVAFHKICMSKLQVCLRDHQQPYARHQPGKRRTLVSDDLMSREPFCQLPGQPSPTGSQIDNRSACYARQVTLEHMHHDTLESGRRRQRRRPECDRRTNDHCQHHQRKRQRRQLKGHR